MEFADSEIIGKPDTKWADLVKKIQGLHNRGRQWVFRAIGKWDPEWNAPVEVPITSSFDNAWDRRVKADWKGHPRPGNRRLYEAWILYEFKREAHNYLAHLPDPANFLEWMALGRHYGMPSRLVDFTYSFFVAAYFALSQRDGKDDGCMVALNLSWMKKAWEARRAERYPDYTGLNGSFHSLELFHKFAFNNGDNSAPGDTYAIIVNPLRRHPRLANQKGCFLCPGNIEIDADKNLAEILGGQRDVKRLVRLPAGLKTEAMRALAEMNVSQATLYPDLIGWAESRRDLVHREIPDDRFEDELNIAIRSPRI
jgi:hypothetical protein